MGKPLQHRFYSRFFNGRKGKSEESIMIAIRRKKCISLNRRFLTVVKLTMISFAVGIIPCDIFAHSIFIQSGRYQVQEGKKSPLFFCYGHHFPVDDAVRAKKLRYIKLFEPDGTITDIKVRDEVSLHSYAVEYEKPGTWVLAAETNPGFFAMYIDKKGRKRHSLKPLNTFIDDAQSVTSSMRSSQWTKTYVTCKEPSSSFPAEIGLPLELLPQKDPGLLKKGDSITFRVHYDGKPYPGDGFYDATYNGFSTEAEDMYIQKTAVSGGTFTVSIDEPGRWYVRFYTKTESPEEKRAEYLTEKRTSTITFLVRNERKGPETDSH